MGTAFTYQGRLLDNNVAADGLYDLQFKLYDDPNILIGSQIGSMVTEDDVDVDDGYFITRLDFGSAAFGGDTRWLQIAVRPYDSIDPNDYVPLNPLQEISAAPYAHYALETSWNRLMDIPADFADGVDNTGSGGDTDWTINSNDMYSNVIGNVGIGTVAPAEKLDVDGSINSTETYQLDGEPILSNEGFMNFFAGQYAGYSNTSGLYNAAIGSYALNSNTDGERNSAAGSQALFNNTTGSTNTALGYQAGFSNSTGSGNVFLGHEAGFNETGSNKLYIANSDTNPPLIYGDFSSGNVGIGTVTPSGKLDVNGAIYQRGGVLHADYVFEADYNLETIEQHADFMWTNKHLPSIPKAAVDETGQEIVEVGAHRKGIVEELEKAHIYIEQLNKHNKELEARLTQLEAILSDMNSSQQGEWK
jgi:hypothetical protein